MVREACAFAVGVPGYERVYLHTNVDIPGAERFWRSLATEVWDARTTGEHGGFGTVHFEIPAPWAFRDSRLRRDCGPCRASGPRCDSAHPPLTDQGRVT